MEARHVEAAKRVSHRVRCLGRPKRAPSATRAKTIRIARRASVLRSTVRTPNQSKEEAWAIWDFE